MLKGHTKIELTNVNTGEVKVVEDDNIVTNAMAKMFEEMPYCKYNLDAPNPFNSYLPYIDRLCGGILLFKDPIEENPDNWMLPKGNKMTGNGRINYASPNNIPEFGAFNAEESSYDSGTGERKYVYDFGTSKANGTISCVALTNFLNGYCGLGNSSGKREFMTVENVKYGNSGLFQNYFWGSSYGFANISCPSSMVHPSSGKILFADYNENAIYVFNPYALNYDSSYATHHVKYGNLKVSKVEFPFRSFNPMFRFGNERIHKVVKQIDIPVPSEISSMSTSYTKYSTVCRTDDAIYILFTNRSGNYTSANGDIRVWKIGYDLKTSEYFTVKNTTGVDVIIASGSGSPVSFIEDGYLICYAKTYDRMFKIKLSDPTDVTELERSEGSYTNTDLYFKKIGNTLIATSYNYTLYYVVNLEYNTWTVVNGCFDPTSNASSAIKIRGKDNFLIQSSSDYFASSSTNIIYNPFFLSTINNLPEPVVKTSDLSMKITYTLTPLGDEEEGDS